VKSHSTAAIEPGATIGVLGSGQLGRMFAIAARQMGYRVHTFSPDDDTPTGQVADREWQAPYEDLDRVRQFAQNVAVVTFEFENIPADTAAAVAECVPVRPGGNVLYVTQHRLREKNFLREHGFPVVPYRAINSLTGLEQALVELGTPAVLKTAGWGYDGKGQSKITSPLEAAAAWQSLATGEAVLEGFIDFDCEISVVAARSLTGQLADFGVMHNMHQRHILDVTVSPADLPAPLIDQARTIAHGVLEALQVVGVLCVEFFVTKQGTLLINELAPRPHNSGHLTVDACVTSQFEQQVRAVCGLPLGATDQVRPAAMANLLGDLWEQGPPNWSAALADSRVKLHLYGKVQPRIGRKMGHLTVIADTPHEAQQAAIAARQRLTTRS
jgi:5-(carboxyamino)imidazole ribonucleotide synthase